MIIEEKSSSDLQQVVEEAVKSNSEKLTSKEPESGNILLRLTSLCE